MRSLAMAAIALALAGCSDDFMLAFGPAQDQDGGPTDTHIALGGPTYYGEVDDVLAEHCWRCHSETGGLGITTDFTIADEAVDAAEGITLRAHARTMPPFFATNDGTCQVLDQTGREALDDYELAVLQRWVQRGSQVGVLDESVRPMPPMLTSLTAPNLSVSTPPFTPARTETRCFVVSLPAGTGPEWVTGVEVTPGSPTVVHNVVVWALDSTDDATTATMLETDDAAAAMAMSRTPRGGYPCEGGPGAEVHATPLAVWIPGTGAISMGADAGIALARAPGLVVQIHYDASHAAREGGPQTDGGGIDGGPRHIVTDETRIDMTTVTTAPTHVLRVVRVAPTTLALDPGQARVTATGTGNVAAGDVVRGVFPLMYRRGVSLGLASSAGCLLAVDHWDLGWRQRYDYAAGHEPAFAAADTLTVTCTFDTRGDTDPVPAGDDPDTSESCAAYVVVTN